MRTLTVYRNPNPDTHLQERDEVLPLGLARRMLLQRGEQLTEEARLVLQRQHHLHVVEQHQRAASATPISRVKVRVRARANPSPKVRVRVRC